MIDIVRDLIDIPQHGEIRYRNYGFSIVDNNLIIYHTKKLQEPRLMSGHDRIRIKNTIAIDKILIDNGGKINAMFAFMNHTNRRAIRVGGDDIEYAKVYITHMPLGHENTYTTLLIPRKDIIEEIEGERYE